MKRWLVDRGGLLALVVAIVYIAVASPYIADGDSAELVTVGNVGGSAHPSGYPLYLLWLRAMSWLPGSTAASTAATATALLGVAQVLVLHAACRAWGARPTAATLAVAIYAGAPIVLRYHSEAEVFALNGLVVATILWLAASDGPLRGGRRTVALALVAGLGMADHMSCTLLAPVGLVGAIRGVREARARAATIGLGAIAFVVGLAPYAYLFVTSGSGAAWGPLASFDDLYGLITRRAYGGANSFAAIGGDTTLAGNLLSLADTLGRAWLWLPAIAGVVTIGWQIARRGNRVAWSAFALSFLLAGPIVVGAFNVELDQLGVYVVQRFYLLPALLLCIPVAVAFDAGLAKLRVPPLVDWVAPIVVVVATATSLSYLVRVRNSAIELMARNALRSLPDHAIAILRSDDTFYATTYLQETEGERTDVTIVSWWMLVYPWYRDRLAARGLALDPYATTPGPPVRRVAEQVFKTGRPLFTETQDPKFGASYPSYPYGVFASVAPPGTKAPTIDEVVTKNRKLYAAYDLSDPKPGKYDEYPTAVHARYAFTWLAIAKMLADAGRPDDAKAAIAVAREIGPQP